jgi:hypothetical protein
VNVEQALALPQGRYRRRSAPQLGSNARRVDIARAARHELLRAHAIQPGRAKTVPRPPGVLAADAIATSKCEVVQQVASARGLLERIALASVSKYSRCIG